MAGLIISVITNKGGTGKTTTVVSLGQALVREGKKILVVDNDSQCNASNILLEGEPRNSLFEILKSDKCVPIDDCIYSTEFEQNLHCIPNVPDTATLEPELIQKGTKEGFNVLRKGLRNYALENFDITLIDNPPNMGIFVVNSLHCSDFAIVPTEAGSTHSIRGLIKAVQFIQDIGNDPEGNPGLSFLRLLVTKVDRRTSVNHIIMDQLKAQFGKDHMFETAIPINTSIQKAELMDQTVFEHDSKSTAAKAYQELAKELIPILEQQE
ncbi:MAG: ParA family protein [Desulfobacterales bacterium]